MSNPLYQQIAGQQSGGLNDIMQRFQRFRQAFSGDPRAQVQQMLNSGRISQAQYNNAVQLAEQMRRLIRG